MIRRMSLENPLWGAVCAENSDSHVSVMQPADERARFDASYPLNRTWNWRILVQGAMCPRLIVIMGIRAKDAAQVLRAEYHEVVNALAPDRANQPFGKTVLPRRTRRNRLVANTHRSQTTPDDCAIDRISIKDQVTWCLVPGESLGDLPRNPFGRRMAVMLTQTSSRRASRTMIKA